MSSQKLKRNDKSNMVNTRIIEPLKDGAFVAGPGQMATPLTKNITNGVKVSNRKKRKHTESQSDYQSLDEMLADPNHNQSLNCANTDGVINGIGSNMPTTGNLVNTLVQGLHSQNEQMLFTVLDRQDSFLVRETVYNLPNDMVEEFLKRLHKLFFTKGDKLIHYYIWLTTLLQEKLSVILMSHNAQQELTSLRQLFATRCDIFDRICALNGRLSLISSLLEPSAKDKELSSNHKTVHYHESSEEDGEENDQDVDENSSDQDHEYRELERIVVMDLSDSEKNSQEEDGDGDRDGDGDDEDNEDEIDVDVGNEDANDDNDEDENEVDADDDGDDEDDDSD